MKIKTLKNGLKIIYHKKKSNSVCIQVNVMVGSNDEIPKIAGISHFIEHMLFEGTKSRPNSFLISNEIEKLGGELNAATSNERTFFYVKVANKHFDIGLDVLSDIIVNSNFEEKLIEKEKKIVVDEIKMVNDQPRYFQWILFQNALYEKHPTKNAVYGKIETVENITRKDVLDYYNKYYVAKNMTVTIIGDVPDPIKKIEDKFSLLSTKPAVKKPLIKEPFQKKVFQKVVKKKTLQAYMIMGYKTVPRNHKDSYALDVIRAIVGRGQSGKIFNEIRTKRGLAYDVGVYHNPSTDYGYFAVYVNTNKKNLKLSRSIIIKELQKLKQVESADIIEAKTFLEGEYLLQIEENHKMAEFLSFWDQAYTVKAGLDYIKEMKKVTADDIKKAVEKYFNYDTIAVIQ